MNGGQGWGADSSKILGKQKKNVKGNLPKIMKIRLGVGVVLYLNFDFTVHFLVFDSIFLQGFQKKGGGATPW